MQVSSDGQTLIRVSESDIVDGSCQICAGITVIGDWAFKNCTNLQTITLPVGVTDIGAYAFAGCVNLKTLTLSVGITAIRTGTFFNCTNLETLNLPAGITAIKLGAFAGCVNLKTLNLPVGVTTIGQEAFGECSSLQRITLPAGVRNIHHSAFLDCNSLALIIIASDDETEIARITHLLPEELRSKVISKRLFDDVIHFQEQQLAKLLATPQTNRLYSFFNYTSRCVPTAILEVKNEQGVEEQKEQRCTKLPSDIFLHLNQLASSDNRYYQYAQAAIKRIRFPTTAKELEDYKTSLDKLVTQYIEKAMEQAERFRVPKTPSMAKVEVTVCAPAV
ncbi:leucine-rich repeat domain-containing protein [Legionella micdadei]|uniref:Leucine rich repeat-containing protein n=1 Tax=Legionella micdadei TaxID=451 RepID=A0A098GFH2_LEGMI|nr:leucine-rich repeat domain-containing protein [Legionella micdadei]ARG98110.1 hypothetical protein B6N58_10830 [Legionella micdadei]KTD30050.1 hypothetical protein Lmic_0231 [Legionella micdadei]NSL18573.1 leucine-rich repeat domain-containing protein [Legionella micdadei]CEG60241.1 protein of unknown function [Legionella micdadei]SCY57998.1 Leucine rich repeat-containing protein [Legionella micdadei]